MMVEEVVVWGFAGAGRKIGLLISNFGFLVDFGKAF